MSARISIVLCTYNGDKYLALQLDSILSQTYPIYEIILQDDCSSDGTKEIINDYASKYPVIKPFFNEKNLGFKSNFSDAVSKATGDYIAFSDQDDIWLPDHIETLVNLIGDKPMACADSTFIDSEGNKMDYTLSQEIQYLHHFEDGIDCAYRIFYNYGAYPGHNSLIKADFIKKSLPVPDVIDYHDFWFSSLACFQGGINFTYKPITLYRQHQNTVTLHKKFSLIGELKMRHHFDFSPKRIDLYNELLKRDDISARGKLFLEEFRQYAIRCPFFKYRLWCWKWRFTHYKKIYSTNSLKYFIPRSIQYILLPSFTKRKDIEGLME